MVIKIAITGNIASGKSQAEKLIQEEYNLPVYDSDNIAHNILDSMDNFFDYDVFTNGKIDRKKLGKLVFSDAAIKEKLEQIIHPKVKDEILKIFEKHRADKFVFVSVPLLYETGFETIFDKVIFISVDKELQFKRLKERNSLTDEEAYTRINSQLPQEEKINRADYTISNNSDIESFKYRLRKTIEQIIH